MARPRTAKRLPQDAGLTPEMTTEQPAAQTQTPDPHDAPQWRTIKFLRERRTIRG
jgi:hypothetical protein